jgi:predicted O-methyltransferase YrrM
MPTFLNDDWFSGNISNFVATTKYLGTINSILEIGSNEGRSSCWMLANMLSPTGEFTCIDPFVSKRALSAFDFDEIIEDRTLENRFRANINEVKKNTQSVRIKPTLSFLGLAELIVERNQYDFIYVDGSHTAEEVLADVVMSFGLLRKGGIMIMDDYLWNHVPEGLDRPKMSIDSFINMFARKLDIKALNYLDIIQKK